MRTIIAGSRGIDSYPLVALAVVESGFRPTVVLSGTARGVDRLGEKWAELFCIPVERYRADWSAGRGAGHARNLVMAQRAHALVALWDGKSPGTANMIATARRLGLCVYVKTL